MVRTTLVIGSLPVIVGVAAGSITDSSVLITWSTDVACNSQVEYGLNSGYGVVASDANLVTTHSVAISGLARSTIYHFRVHSQDVDGDIASSSDAQFTTTGDRIPPVISEVNWLSDTTTSIWISWTTNEVGTSLVSYGLTSAYGNASPLDSTLVVSHNIRLAGLLPDTTYHFSVASQDGSGNAAVSLDSTFMISSAGGGSHGIGVGSGVGGNSVSGSGTCNAGGLSILLAMALLSARLTSSRRTAKRNLR